MRMSITGVMVTHPVARINTEWMVWDAEVNTDKDATTKQGTDAPNKIELPIQMRTFRSQSGSWSWQRNMVNPTR